METVCIPRERYEYRIKCEQSVDMEFEEKFSDAFIAEVKESEKAYTCCTDTILRIATSRK